MLEQSKSDLANAAGPELVAAEIIAHRYLVSELEQNLIPTDDAVRTIDERKAQKDETWSRAVLGILMGLRSARANGLYLKEGG